MKSIRKILVLMLALMLVTGVIEAASAEIKINFTFIDLTSTSDSKIGTVKQDASSFYVILESSSTVSAVNIFGYRARLNDSSETRASSYQTMNYIGKKTTSFYSAVSAGDKVFFRCKKDNSSSYGGPLNADGAFYP